MYIFERNTFILAVKEDPRDYLEVEVGDRMQEEFFPQVKIKRWDNEVNFSARLKDWDKTLTLTPTLSQGERGLISWAREDVEARFYPHSDPDLEEGGFEFEVVLNKKPPTNILEFTIQTKGLDFFYQPPLTPEEIASGHVRPENVVGSYAVYHSERKGDYSLRGGMNYRAGKVFHIYRPEAKDAASKTSWCELRIDVASGILQVVIPQDWMDGAEYPVTIDPTFGYDSIGASSSNSIANYVSGSAFTAPADVLTATSISQYFFGGTAGYFKGLMILHSTLNLLTNGIGSGFYVDSSGWKTSSFPTPPNLSPATDYVIAGIYSASNMVQKYDTGAANQSHLDDSNSYSSPENLGSVYHSTEKFSIYCTYTAPTEIGVSDSIALTDEVDVAQQLSVSDSLALADAISLEIATEISVSDSITVSDSDPELTIYVAIADTLSVTESLAFRKGQLIVEIESPILNYILVDSKIG